MQEPRNRGSHIVLEFEIQQNHGLPSIVIVRPVRRAGERVSEVTIFTTIGNTLRLRILRELRTALGWSDHRLRNQVTGVLQMNNIHDANHAHTEDVKLGDVKNNSCMELFNRATGAGSNADITIYDVEWQYWVNAASIRGGGSLKFSNKNKLGGINGWNFKLPSVCTNIGCAALSLAMNRIHKEKTTKYIRMSKEKIPKQVAQECYDIQEEMQFNDNLHVTIQEFEKYVLLYPKYRIVIIQSVFTQCEDYRGKDYIMNTDRKKDKTYYIYYDFETQHFTYCSAPQQLVRSFRKNPYTKWCYQCASWYQGDKEGSSCHCKANEGKKPNSRKRIICECGKEYYKSEKHQCGETKCHFCQLFFKSDDVKNHRCPLYTNPETFMKRFDDEELIEGDGYKEKDRNVRHQLFVWDIESHLVPILDKEEDEFEVDEEGHFIMDEDNRPISYTIQKCQQLPNFVAWENVFTGQKWSTYDFKEFIDFALAGNNKGYNMFIAHNSHGYDTRLLFEEICKVSSTHQPEPIFRGSKFMRLVMNGRTIFQDSVLHLPRSLKELAGPKGFNLEQTKGYFPHLFNRPENINYIGPIPSKENFDLSFIAKSKKDLDDFDEWYNSWEGEWNLREELEKYCILDVSLLSQIVKLYHEGILDSLKNYPHLTISPWHFPTVAGHVHKLMIRHVHEGKNIEGLNNEELQEYVQSTWATLEPEEHYFAKQALRGGRTDIRQYYYKGNIHYKDIQSHYPHVQMAYEYPTGTPVIEIHDTDYYPCNVHYENPREKCKHSLENKKQWISSVRYKLKIRQIKNKDLHDYIRHFFGIITVDVTPNPKLYHPVLVIYDEKKKKCIATLEPIINESFTSVELNRAIDMGYVVTKIYRGDRYKKSESIWRNGLLGDLYISKMKNSGPAPEGEDRTRIYDTFKNKFGIELDFKDWDKRPVLKFIAKQPVTSAWGKHAESVDHPQSKIFGEEDYKVGMTFYESINNNQMKVQKFQSLGQGRIMFNVVESRKKQKPDLHKGYLPAAVFVTSYARLYLWEELNKLGNRVLMHDTDSIIYSDDPNGYDIPEGDCLGDWETEDFEKDNGGITEFISIGPKSYCIKGNNGKEFMKLKGASIKYAHEKMINMEVMIKMLKEGYKLPLPQMSFVYGINKGISTHKFLKRIQFDKNEVKGDYNPLDYRNYPYGYHFE